MVEDPLPDWMQKALLVGTYDDEPILVTVDGLGQLIGGLTAYNNSYVRTYEAESTGTDLTIYSHLIPAGEVWVITNIAAYHDDPIPREVKVYLATPTDNILLFSNPFLLENEVMARQGNWILKAGKYIGIMFVAVADGKTCYYNVTGYKVKVAT